MLLDLAIKATVLLAIGLVLGVVLRHASAASRHTVWTTVFVAMLLLPGARFVMPEWAVIAVPDRFWDFAGTSSDAPAPSTQTAAGQAAGLDVTHLSDLQSRGWWSTAAAGTVWVAGAAGWLVWIGTGLAGTRRLERRARLVGNERVTARAARAAALLGVRRPVRFLTVSKDVMPSTWGLKVPRVLLPEGANAWTDARLDAVLTHELSHVARGDAASHLVARLAAALWWWHPMVWVAARAARLERERACDDLVLTQGACASDYAADLVTIVSSLRLPAADPATLAMARRSQLEERVMAILRSDVNRQGVSQAGFMAALLVMALVWPLAAARPAAAQDPAQAPVRIGSTIPAPAKIKDMRPVYPESAKSEGRQGVAIIEAQIGADGFVSDAKVIRSIGEDLDNAALDAVLQWAFTPTKLNGVAVPVIMTVTVNFTLGGGVAPPPPPPPPTDPPVVGDVVAPPAPPPPPPAPLLVNGVQPLRIGGAIDAPTKIKDVRPVYPDVAQQSRISGIVIIEAVIDQEGSVVKARVIRSVPLLDEAALDAVLQWKFTPTHLNGVAVPIIMTVTVNFTLT